MIQEELVFSKIRIILVFQHSTPEVMELMTGKTFESFHFSNRRNLITSRRI